MTLGRPKGISNVGAPDEVPTELQQVLTELYNASEASGKSFPRMRAYADRIQSGECSGIEAIRIVIRLLDPPQTKGGGMSIEECKQHLEEEAEVLEAELSKITGREAELKDAILKARTGAAMLGEVAEGKRIRMGGISLAARNRKATPCEWPGCEVELRGGYRKHNEKHERETGMTLEQARAQVTPISA